MRFLYKIEKTPKWDAPGQGVISLFGILVALQAPRSRSHRAELWALALLDAFAVGVAKRTFNNAHGQTVSVLWLSPGGAGVGVDRFLHKQKYCQSGRSTGVM